MENEAGRTHDQEVAAGLLLVRSSPRRYPLGENALKERVRRALEVGAQTAALLRRRWPEASAVEIARDLGVSVVEQAARNDGPETAPVRLAAFLPGRGIILHAEGVREVATALRVLLPEDGRRAGAVEGLARELLVAHELFHVLGRLRRKERPERLALPRRAIARELGYPARCLGVPFRAAIPELEEVAAHGFSTAWTGLAVPALRVHARISARYDARWAGW